MSIGSRLKEERTRLEYDQDEFSAIGGVGKQAQSKYENDKRMPDADYLTRIGQVGVDIFYILTGQRLHKDGVKIYNDTGEALNVVIDIQRELGLVFDAKKLQSIIGFAWTAQASRDQIVAFVRGAYAFSGLEMPEPPKPE